MYALGDLSPGICERCEWYGRSEPSPAAVMLYHGFGEPILFAMGAPDGVGALLNEIDGLDRAYLHVHADLMPLIRERFDVLRSWAMWRMILDPARFNAGPSEGVVPVGPEDLGALQLLYASGEETGQSPAFFQPSMLEDRSYFGIYEGRELVAAAGTHFVAEAVSVGAMGNVFTRPDRRGRGFARKVTCAVAEELLRRGMRTVALNVDQTNAPALHLYERIGFERYCAYYEGTALKRVEREARVGEAHA